MSSETSEEQENEVKFKDLNLFDPLGENLDYIKDPNQFYTTVIEPDYTELYEYVIKNFNSGEKIEQNSANECIQYSISTESIESSKQLTTMDTSEENLLIFGEDIMNFMLDFLNSDEGYKELMESDADFRNIDILTIFDNSPEKLQKFLDNGIEQSKSLVRFETFNEERSFLIIPSVKTFNGILYLTRGKPHLFSIYYNGFNQKQSKWFIQIQLISGNSTIMEETLEFCKKAKHDESNWFICNGEKVELGSDYIAELVNNRIEKIVSLNFPCNNSCSSMYAQTMLKFTILDKENGSIFEHSFNLRISERPGRDIRDFQKKNHLKSEETTIDDFNHPFETITDDIIEGEVPKLVNYTASGTNFDIQLSKKNLYYVDNKFSQKKEQPIEFIIQEASSENPEEKLILKMMIVDPKFPEKAIKCKHNHGGSCNHILKLNGSDAQYVGTENGIYADERLGVEIPVQNEIVVYFMCNNFCYVDRDRPYAGLVLILKTEAGKMLARRFFKYSITTRPNRTRFEYETERNKDSRKNNKRKHKTPISITSKKRKS